MFALAEFNQFVAGKKALSRAWLFHGLRRFPPGPVRNGLIGLTWLETWLRWPLATLKLGDRIDGTLAAIDPHGDRFGLSGEVRERFKHDLLYGQLPNLVTIMNSLDDESVRRQILSIKGGEILERECEAGPGVIVSGFRSGPYPGFPWALAAAAPGREVIMIVSTEHLARLGQKLGERFIGGLNSRVTFLSSMDSAVLARSLRVLKSGGVVATLLELSPVEFARKTDVNFLDWRINVPYGLSYLSAMTGRPVIPAALTHRRGARFRLQFGEPVPAPSRDQDSLQAQTQALYTELERHVRSAPDQWIGWLLLQSHMGIQVPVPGGDPLPALS